MGALFWGVPMWQHIFSILGTGSIVQSDLKVTKNSAQWVWWGLGVWLSGGSPSFCGQCISHRDALPPPTNAAIPPAPIWWPVALDPLHHYSSPLEWVSSRSRPQDVVEICSPRCWDSIAVTPISEASTSTMKCFVGSRCVSTVVSACFSCENASSAVGFQINLLRGLFQ